MFMIVMCDCDMTCDMSPFSYIIGVNVQVCASRDAARDVRGVASWASCSPLTRSRGLFNFSPYSVPRYEHTTQAVHRLPLTCLCLGLSQVPPRRQQERQRIRIHGPRSLPRPRPRASVSSFLALKVRPASGQHRISNPRR